MTSKRDYYETLGVSRSGTEEEIRKAFRQKALQYHPDRNKDADATEKFKEVNEAYQVLTDPQRRQQYDRFGHAAGGAQTGQGFDGFDVFCGFGDIFESFFGGGTSTRTRPRASQGSDLQSDLRVKFEDAVFGAVQEVNARRMEQCGRCDGTRSEPGSSPVQCETCHGNGRVRRTQKSIFGQFIQEGACPTCNGTGERIVTPCTQCHGSGRERKQRKIQVDIPAGVEDGITLQLRGEGDVGELGAPPGDLYILLRVDPHAFFKRSQYDILLDMDITYPQAALGADITVPTLQGEETLHISPGTQPSAVFRLKGQGVPHLQSATKRGDEVIRLNVATPKELTKRQRELLEELSQTFSENGADDPEGSKNWFRGRKGSKS